MSTGKKCVRFTFGPMPHEIVVFTKYENGEIKCHGPLGEIERDKSLWEYPIYGSFRFERVAWDRWPLAIKMLLGDL